MIGCCCAATDTDTPNAIAAAKSLSVLFIVMSVSGCGPPGQCAGLTARSAETALLASAIWWRRIGFSTNHASSAAAAFITLATMKTACQLAVIAVNTLDSGTRSDAVPFAVYSMPALAAAYFAPNVSAQVDGKRL